MPEMLASKAFEPIATLSSPVVLAVSAASPIATLSFPPPSTESKAVLPNATLLEPVG